MHNQQCVPEFEQSNNWASIWGKTHHLHRRSGWELYVDNKQFCFRSSGMRGNGNTGVFYAPQMTGICKFKHVIFCTAWNTKVPKRFQSTVLTLGHQHNSCFQKYIKWKQRKLTTRWTSGNHPAQLKMLKRLYLNDIFKHILSWFSYCKYVELGYFEYRVLTLCHWHVKYWYMVDQTVWLTCRQL